MVRVFVGTSHINTLYMILYARKTFKEGFKDILVLDSVPKKRSLIDLLVNTKKIYHWAGVIDLSLPVADESELAPGLRKKITRKLKTNVFVKPVYDILLSGYIKKKQKAEENILRKKLASFGEVGEINLLTQTGINNALMALYPAAKINYFEHGLGDYFFIQKMKPVNFTFYSVFADTFRNYLAKRGVPADFVKDLLEGNSFSDVAQKVIETDEDKEKILSSIKIEGKKVLIFLESMEIHNVLEPYWTDYLDLCISRVDNPKEYVFILKPHHNQTTRTIQLSKNYMLQRGLNTVLIENNLSLNYGAEVLYDTWKDSVKYVFSTYSSALFYISKLYGGAHTKYYYAFDFYAKYMKNTPLQYVEGYKGLNSLVKEVFSDNCTDISPR
ncbi:MAG TPA: polysialyltransferase family glycosyltransferase [Bacteroidia bacterium]|jgi:hypothetical protein|nr:polysialyltransferase family glycosyltransferase [Bacteroidia bacterium]